MSSLLDLPTVLGAALEQAPPGPLCVAFSAGVDSSTLLHALSEMHAARERGLRAVHIDHGLQPEASRWVAAATAFATRCGVTLRSIRVEVEPCGEGIEAAARTARYAAFARELAAGELLLTAQHRDDQAETVLLRLLHGAGSEGLAGMRRLRRFGAGWLWRPLLEQPRRLLLDYAAQHRLSWVEDPSNRDARLARSWLRSEIVPSLSQRWPDATARIAQAAARLRDESDVLDRAARTALAQARSLDRAALRIDIVQNHAETLQRRLLGLWLDELGLPRPPPPVWSRIAPDLLHARPDAEPCIAWRGAELRRYRNLLYAMQPLAAVQPDWSVDWNGLAPLLLPAGCGMLGFDPAPAQPLSLQVRARRGGERIRLHGQQHSELRKRLQEIGLPPWQRERLPLLFDREGELLAAGDLLIGSALQTLLGVHAMRLWWRSEAELTTDLPVA